MTLARIYFVWISTSMLFAAVAHMAANVLDVKPSIPVADLLSRISGDTNHGIYFSLSYFAFPALLYCAAKSADFKQVKQTPHPFAAIAFTAIATCFFAYICVFISPDFDVGGGRFSLLLIVSAKSWLMLGFVYGSLLYIASIFVILLKISMCQLKRRI